MANKTWQDTEKDFQSKIKSLGKKAYLHRITDTKEVNRGKSFGQKVIVKKTPADYILSYEGEMVYAEVKHCCNETSFPFSMLTDGQMIAITRQNAAECHYLIFIYHATEDQWYLINGLMVSETLKKGKKSLAWKDLEKHKLTETPWKTTQI